MISRHSLMDTAAIVVAVVMAMAAAVLMPQVQVSPPCPPWFRGVVGTTRRGCLRHETLDHPHHHSLRRRTRQSPCPDRTHEWLPCIPVPSWTPRHRRRPRTPTRRRRRRIHPHKSPPPPHHHHQQQRRWMLFPI